MDGKERMFAHMVWKFELKVAVVDRAILSCNNPMQATPEGN